MYQQKWINKTKTPEKCIKPTIISAVSKASLYSLYNINTPKILFKQNCFFFFSMGSGQNWSKKKREKNYDFPLDKYKNAL